MKLAECGVDFIVDEKLIAFISRFKWREMKTKTAGRKYFYTCLGGKRILLHRMVFGLFGQFSIDHVNSKDYCDNTLDNLRPASTSQNLANSIRPRKTNRFRGIYKNRYKWCCIAQRDGKQYRNYGFSSDVEAAKAYDKLAKMLWGEYAVLNFPEMLK